MNQDEKYFLSYMEDKEKNKYVKKYNDAIADAYEIAEAYIDAKCSVSPNIQVKWNIHDHCYRDRSQKMGNSYVILLYLYTFMELERYLKERNCPQGGINCIIYHSVVFIYLHEVFHILYGHCSIPVDARIDTMTRKRMEYACDMKALDIMFSNADIAYAETKSITQFQEQIALLLASFVVLFKRKEEYQINEMQENLGTEKYKTYTDGKRDHPFSTFRFDYLVELIEEHLYAILKDEKEVNRYIEETFDLADVYLELYGMGGYFKLNPTSRRNRKEIEKIRNVDFDLINSYCKEIFIDDLKHV